MSIIIQIPTPLRRFTGESGEVSVEATTVGDRRRRARLPARPVPRRGRRRALGLVDFDVVDASNLQRQVLYGTADVGGRSSRSPRERHLDSTPT
jgi:hypothetical protein